MRGLVVLLVVGVASASQRPDITAARPFISTVRGGYVYAEARAEEAGETTIAGSVSDDHKDKLSEQRDEQDEQGDEQDEQRDEQDEQRDEQDERRIELSKQRYELSTKPDELGEQRDELSVAQKVGNPDSMLGASQQRIPARRVYRGRGRGRARGSGTQMRRDKSTRPGSVPHAAMTSSKAATKSTATYSTTNSDVHEASSAAPTHSKGIDDLLSLLHQLVQWEHPIQSAACLSV